MKNRRLDFQEKQQMPDVMVEMWRDEDGVRLAFSKAEIDLSFEATGKLINALDDFLSVDPNGSYKIYRFDISEKPK